MSKLTDGIVKQNRNVGCYFDWYMEDLLAHARDLEAMLRKHEWAGVEWDGDYYDHMDKESCPECLGWKDNGHSHDCELARLIDG